MRAVFYSDVSAAARALCAVAPHRRADLCKQMIREADVADRFTRRLGKVHPLLGRGTLREAAARHHWDAEPGFDDRDYCACMMHVLAHLRLRPRLIHM